MHVGKFGKCDLHENMRVKNCFQHAIRNPSKTKRDHWLDRADDKFDRQFIEDVKAALQVFVLYIPLPIFWALFDQQVRN